MTRAGIVAVVGLPNAGKSTLLNRLVQQKLAITSPKPQSTRDRVVGIVTDDACQMVVVDTPGLLAPSYSLQRAMRGVALEALYEADVIVHLADACEGPANSLMDVGRLDRTPRGAIVTAYNKAELLTDAQRQPLAEATPNAIFISATTGEGVAALVARVQSHLPESPFLYSADDASTQSVRFFVTEIVREVAFDLLDEELPYAVACEIEEFREDRQPVYIRAVLYVERESQKRILIGSKGSRIRDIGREARLKVESLIEQPVYLDLWVKVLHNWRRNTHTLKRLGYVVPEEQES